MPAKFELKKTSVNEYPSITKQEKLKGLGFKIFQSLEAVVKNYENLVLIKQEYDDKPSGWRNNLINGKLVYQSFQDPDKKCMQSCLEIHLLGGFRRSSAGILEGTYNKIDIQFQSDTKEVDTKVVSDLVNKFKSFEEMIQKSQERIDRLIFSEE